MTATSTVAPAPRPARALRTILFAGLLAGALDIAYVFVYFHTADPFAILRNIAAGLLGAAAVKGGGHGLAALGLALHFVIALGAAAVFYAASRKLPVLTRHAVGSGLLFGIVVYLVMNGVVLPLDANPPKAFPWTLPPARWLPVFIAHLLCVGLPIALVVRRCAPCLPRRRREKSPGALRRTQPHGGSAAGGLRCGMKATRPFQNNHVRGTALKPPTQQQISALAYELWLAQGSPEGSDLDIWLEAERQVLGGKPRSAERDPIPADPDHALPDEDPALHTEVERQLDVQFPPRNPRSPTSL